MGLLLGLFDQTRPFAFQRLQFGFVLFGKLLHPFFSDSYPVAFLLPIAAIAGNLPQLAFEVDVVTARFVGSPTDNLLRQSDLAGDFDCKRAAGTSHL